MTIPVSTVPAVRAAIAAGVTALINDPSVVVSDGPPSVTKDDMIVIDGVTREVRYSGFVGSGGAGWLEEIYHLKVVVQSFRGGDNFPTVIARAWALTSVVETFVRTDPSIGALLIVSHPEQSDESDLWEENNKGPIVTITTPIYCHARI